jgi:tetratricopeptide (TPR) repeat protein
MTRSTGLGLFLFLGAFALYLHGAYPTVSVGDSGEFITAGHTLGIPHAPGYPSYILLAKAADTLLPWAHTGYRINLLSAVCGASAVVLLFAAALQLGLTRALAFCAAGVFMLVRAQVVNAQASEVFALHAALCAAVLWASFAGRWRLAAFLAGWGMGNHQTLLFLLPALALAYASRPAEERIPILHLTGCFLAGLSVYAFLYIRAQASPVFNVGDPQTLERFWRVLTRADYGSLTLALGDTPPRDLPSTLRQLERFALGMSAQVGWAGVAVGLVGIAASIRQRSSQAGVLSGAFLLIGPFFFVLGNLPFNGQSLGLLERFYIVPVMLWTLLMAAGIQALTLHRNRLGWIAFALPLFLAVEQVRAGSFRQDFRAYSYGKNNLNSLPPGSLLVIDGGDDTFYTLAYLTRVEKKRPDITLHDRGGVVFPGFYGSDFRQLTREEKEPRRLQVERAVLASGRPLYYSTMNDRVFPERRLTQEGLLYAASPLKRADLWALYDLRDLAPWMASSGASSIDYRTRALIPFYAYQRSVAAQGSGSWETALSFAASAQAQGPDVLWLTPNLLHNAYAWGSDHFNAGRLDQATAAYRLITRWDPGAAAAWSNLGAIDERRQKLDQAVRHYQKALELDPASEAAHYNLAVAYWKLSDWPNVAAEFSRVLAINPNNAAARNYLVQAQARLKQADR